MVPVLPVERLCFVRTVSASVDISSRSAGCHAAALLAALRSPPPKKHSEIPVVNRKTTIFMRVAFLFVSRTFQTHFIPKKSIFVAPHRYNQKFPLNKL